MPISRIHALAALAVAAGMMQAGAAAAQTTAEGYQAGQYVVHLDAAGVFKDASAKVYVGGPRFPGGSVTSPDDATITFDLDYFLTPHFAVDLYAGLPPRAVVKGAGTLKPFGTLATTNYGPAVLSAEYHFGPFAGLDPFIAAGVNYTLFLNVHHEALYNVKIPDAFGAAFKIGLNYQLDPNWSLNAYVMHILLGTRVSASVDPGDTVPAVAKTTINPTIVAAGFGYAF